MAKITKVVLKKSLKIVKNYNSTETSIILEAELDENDDFAQIKAELSEKAKQSILEDMVEDVEMLKV